MSLVVDIIQFAAFVVTIGFGAVVTIAVATGSQRTAGLVQRTERWFVLLVGGSALIGIAARALFGEPEAVWQAAVNGAAVGWVALVAQLLLERHDDPGSARLRIAPVVVCVTPLLLTWL